MNVLDAFREQMLDCEIYRDGVKIAMYKGLVSDSKDYNVIDFDPDCDVQIGDDIFCIIKKKHYKIVNTDIAVFDGKAGMLRTFFENNFIPKQSATVFNTYNPTNTIIGNQQSAILNINDYYNNLQNQIDNQNEDKQQLLELLELIKSETSTNQIDKSKFSKFNNLIFKHASWLVPSITQIIAAWIQRG